MGVKVVGTVKSHHTKKKKNVVFDPNIQNENRANPELFFPTKVLRKQAKKQKSRQ